MKRNNGYLLGNQFAKGNGPNRTSFKVGQKPWNTGLKGWCPPGAKKTQFKRGCRGIRFVPIGTIRIRVDKNGKRRRWIKVSETGRIQDRWRIYAAWLWEKDRGAIPTGLFVHHLDGDTMNDSVSNYGLVTRSAHIQKHRAQLNKARVRSGDRPGKGFIRERTNITMGLRLA